jgi:hypothetical protein
MQKATVYAASDEESTHHMRIESEKAGQGIGEAALRRWVRRRWPGLLRTRWLEHLQGLRFWAELDRSDFGLLARRFQDHPLLLDRVLDRLRAGQGNLDIIVWAVEWGIPTGPLLEILEVLSVEPPRPVVRQRHPLRLAGTGLAEVERGLCRPFGPPHRRDGRLRAAPRAGRRPGGGGLFRPAHPRALSLGRPVSTLVLAGRADRGGGVTCSGRVAATVE